MKLSAVSPRIMPGTWLLATTIRWLANAGSMWRATSRGRWQPSRVAASTNSSSRTASSLLRTTRAKPVQPSTDRISVIAK